MWTLTDKNGKVIELPDNDTKSVGRSNSDILLNEDASISRSHAKIQILAHKANNKSKSPNKTKLLITDCSSKYGTYLLQENKVNRITDKGYVASNMDQIRFGLKNHVFTVSYKPDIKYSVLPSGLTEGERKNLIEILEVIGGKLCNQWQDSCTHLTTSTTSTTKLTEKISCALAAGIPIVSLAFWNDVLKAQESNENIPDTNNYIPLSDNLLSGIKKVTLGPNPSRKSIFSGLTFYHFDETQLKLYSTIIRLAGGKSVIFDEFSYEESDCTRDGVIFLQPFGDSETQEILLPQYQGVNDQLKKHQLRSIPSNEIPLAIFYCSVDQFCNPKFACKRLLTTQDKETQNRIRKAKILAPETQDWDDPPRSNKNAVIPETVQESQDLPIISQVLCDLAKRRVYEKLSTIEDDVKEKFKPKNKNLATTSWSERNKASEKRKKDVVDMDDDCDDEHVGKGNTQSKKKKKLDDVQLLCDVESEDADDGKSRDSSWDILVEDSQGLKNRNAPPGIIVLDDDDSDKDMNSYRIHKNDDKNRKKEYFVQKKSKTEQYKRQDKNKEEIARRHQFDVEDNLETNEAEDIQASSEDEHQSSSKWIKSIHKKQSNEADDEIENKTGLGYKVKFVSLDELRGDYIPFRGRNSCQKKDMSSVPPNRLTKEDFYEWVPPKQ